MRAASIACLLFLLCACGDQSDFTRSESQRIFSASTGEIARVHGVYFGATEDLGSPYTSDCEEGGSVTLVLDGEIGADGFPPRVLHNFQDCGLSGLLFNGDLDYVNLESGICDGESFGLDIVGELTVGGELKGRCSFDAREECFEFSGEACGFEVQ